MAETPTPRPWTCPSCGRRVPARIMECHCGFTQTQAVRTAERAVLAGGRSLSWELWGWITVLALSLLFGVWRLFRPYPPNTIPPLLGYVDHPRPSSTPPTPVPSSEASPAPPSN